MENLSETVAGGSIANLLFLILFGIGAWIKSRLQKSNCKVDCGWLTCDSSLVELETIKQKLHHTQRDQMLFLKEILGHVKDDVETDV